MDKLTNFKIDPKRFEIFKENVSSLVNTLQKYKVFFSILGV